MKMMKLVLYLWLVAAVLAEELPPSCQRPVYCNSNLLHCIQTAVPKIYNDSKSFVDLQLVRTENETLEAFDELYNKNNSCPTYEQLQTFVEEYFHNASELDSWNPPDFKENPEFLAKVKDETLKKFARDLNNIWPTLGRKVKSQVIENSDRTSLVPVTNGFIIPGGRFTELYYWDTYFIIKGLLLGEMNETVKGKLKNLLELLKKFGHIPNGSRWYYQERSQPPLFTAMVMLYIQKTKDIQFLKENIAFLEKEIQYWLDTHIVTFEKDDRTHTLLRYFSESKGPRPESYREDYNRAQEFTSAERQQEFYTDTKSAAESGWDFSSRWFRDSQGKNDGNLSTIHTSYIIPVDLNSIFANSLDNVGHFHLLLKNIRKSMHYRYLAKQWKSAIKEVLWDEDDGIWYDYDFVNSEYRRYFYPSNTAPLWMNAVEKTFVKNNGHRVLYYLRHSTGLSYPGGVPTSLQPSNEQWDLPNAWPPTVSIVVNAIQAIETNEAKKVALHVAQTWVRSCYKGFNSTGNMFEKYNALKSGEYGSGGEYVVQSGFGWSNGVVLEFIDKYGQEMTAFDDPDATDDYYDTNESMDDIENSKRSDATRPTLMVWMFFMAYFFRW